MDYQPLLSDFNNRHTFSPSVLAEYKTELRKAILNTGLKLGEGIDRSGKLFQWMIDCREVLLTAKYLHYAGRLLWEQLRSYRPEMIGGMTMSADPLTFAILYEALADGYPLTAFTIRKSPKTYGLRKLVEGPAIRPGTRIVLLDDLVSSGNTLQKALQALKPFNAQLIAVGIVVDFQRKGSRSLRAEQIPMESLFTLSELGITKQTPNGHTHCMLSWTHTLFHKRHTKCITAHSTPAILQDTIFVGSENGFLQALDADGKELWCYAVRGRDQECGIRSSPLVYDGKVYFGAQDGYFYCLNSADGALIWEIRCGQRISSSPTIHVARGLIFVGTEYGKMGGNLIALKAKTGAPVWKLRTSHYVRSSPWFDPIHEQVIAGADDGIIYAAHAITGKLRWQFQTGSLFKGNPVCDRDGICYVGSFDGFLYALNAESGQLKWKKRLGHQLWTTPLIFGDLVIVSGSLHIIAIERLSGRISWIAAVGGHTLGSAVYKEKDMLISGSEHGDLYIFDASSGNVLWHYMMGPIRAIPSVGFKMVLIPSCDGQLYTFMF